MIQANLGAILRAQGELDEALALLELAQGRLEPLLGAGHPQTLAATLELGRVLRDVGMGEEARAYFERVLDAGASAEGAFARSYVEGARQELSRPWTRPGTPGE